MIATRKEMLRTVRSFVLLPLVVAVCGALFVTDAQAQDPAYQIVLRSRHASVMPTRTPNAQTGGGSIVVEQPEPNTIVVTMGGSAVVGSGHHGSSAGLNFVLEQELEIIPTRRDARPPRIGMIGRVVGTLQVTDCGHCGKACGNASQGPATACLSAGEASLLTVAVEPSAVGCAQELAINHREFPVETVAEAGLYHLSGAFRIGAAQGKGVFHRQYAVADFDPAPQLDAFWADALKPFRAVPRNEFGFKLVVRVVEDRPTTVAEEIPGGTKYAADRILVKAACAPFDAISVSAIRRSP
jgi:hypothetical protein